ncbi:ABC transporter B family member 3-like [Spinacia oleracea]|uniref:ABC transporter B family member 3-like n=1 Tax=Spinacia oleracea TaxID=3562 RepID=A0ABM3QJP9_SPIOL|nr:ABC transporter B family member 3-like [Spinacia oleracea]XP_056683586.1 ABC transporter B family member 3-like [Spinacia oleracea]
MEIGWFDEAENSSGTIGARLSADAATILALIVLVLIPLIGISGYLQVKFTQGFSADAKKKYEEASQVANDVVASFVFSELFEAQ